jgi:hypothetical protein
VAATDTTPQAGGAGRIRRETRNSRDSLFSSKAASINWRLFLHALPLHYAKKSSIYAAILWLISSHAEHEVLGIEKREWLIAAGGDVRLCMAFLRCAMLCA